jgi:hypothetical protein
MKCLLCNSVMIYDKLYGLYEYFEGWKCLIRGEIVDPSFWRTGNGWERDK